MKIATWNVNSLNVRLPHVLDWLVSEQPDVLCLQELKIEDSKFPVAQLAEVGYQAVFSGQKTYNGVAILARHDLSDVQVGIPGFEDEQKRVIAATVQGVRVVCGYFPNGQSLDSDKYQYKLRWLTALTEWLRGETGHWSRLVLAGDYNIAPEDRDVHDPAAWVGQILVSEPERAAFKELLNLGLVDAFRQFNQPEASFSWWDYRQAGFRRNLGMRIDHLLVSKPLVDWVAKCWIDKEPRTWERPSDHTPVVVQLAPCGC